MNRWQFAKAGGRKRRGAHRTTRAAFKAGRLQLYQAESKVRYADEHECGQIYRAKDQSEDEEFSAAPEILREAVTDMTTDAASRDTGEFAEDGRLIGPLGDGIGESVEVAMHAHSLLLKRQR